MISVIVPVYKVEKYLDKCVQSILAQTYQDFELILVDDGSPDNCPKICDEYEKRDNRVRVLHKNNGGLSDARNAGTLIANGDCITYIDSDDFVSQNYLSSLITLREKYGADVAVTGISKFLEGDKIRNNQTGKEYCFTGEEALEEMLYQKHFDTSACALLLPTEIARKNKFPVKKYHEDDFTTYKYYVSVKKVAVTTIPHYYYLQRKGSITHTLGQSMLDELEAADNLVDFCKEKYPELIPAALSKKFSDYCQVLLESKDLEKDNIVVYNRIVSFLNGNKKKILFNSRCRMKNRVAALLLICGVNMLLLVNNLIKNRK